MPDFIDSTQLELVHPDELIPITTETLGLYEAWIKYFVFNRIVAFSNNHNGFYDCRKENKYKTLLYLDAKSGISIKKICLRRFRASLFIIVGSAKHLALLVYMWYCTRIAYNTSRRSKICSLQQKSKEKFTLQREKHLCFLFLLWLA